MIKLEKFTRYCLIGLTSLALLMMIFIFSTESGNVNPFVVIITMIPLYFILRFINGLLRKSSKRQLRNIVIGSVLAVTILAILNVIFFRVQLFGDVQICIDMARKISQNNFEWSNWILQYKNLVPLTILYSWMMKIGQFLHTGFYPIFFAYNISLLIGSLVLTLLTLWHKKPQSAALAGLLAIVLPVFYSFIIQVGYTDGASILALSLLIFLFEYNHLNWWKLILLTFVFAYGYLMRPNIIIALVALFIIGLFTYKKQNNIFKLVSKLFIFCFLGIILATSTSKIFDATYHYNANNPKQFPVVHWIYMGLNQEKIGQYNKADRSYTLNHEGFSSAQNADIAGIKNRLLNYRPLTLGLHFINKYGILWHEGTFQTLTDYQKNYIFAPKLFLKYSKLIFLVSQVFSKALISLFLFFLVLELLRKKPIPRNSILLSLLIIFGISLFHTIIWEVKTRYQFMTFFLLFFVGVYAMVEYFEKDNF